MATDLLARIHAELEQRMAELGPFLDEYERLLAAVDELAVLDSTSGSARAGVSAARPDHEPEPKRARKPRLVLEPGPELRPPLEPELRPEPKPRRGRASSNEAMQAIVAALEHGSHTLSELVMVTAMNGPEIRASLRRLARQRKVVRVKRSSDTKSAYALALSSRHV
jgi:hypothetical protein